MYGLIGRSAEKFSVHKVVSNKVSYLLHTLFLHMTSAGGAFAGPCQSPLIPRK